MHSGLARRCLWTGFRKWPSIVWCHPLTQKSQILHQDQKAHGEHCIMHGSGVFAALSTACGTDLKYFARGNMLLASFCSHLRNVQLLQTVGRAVRRWFWEAAQRWRRKQDKFLEVNLILIVPPVWINQRLCASHRPPMFTGGWQEDEKLAFLQWFCYLLVDHLTIDLT